MNHTGSLSLTVFSILFTWLVAGYGMISPECLCGSRYPEYTANEYSMELFNSYERIALLRLDSVIDTTRIIPEQFVYTTLIKAVKGDWSDHPVGLACRNCPCGNSPDKRFIGDTMVVFTENNAYMDFELESCALYHFLVPGYLPQRQKFIDQYTQTKSGQPVTFYSNGYLTSKGSLNKAGNPEGYWEYYTFDGQLKSSGNYRDGVKVGEWIEYRFMEKILSDSRGYVPQLYSKGTYENGVATGIWTWYSLDGKMISTTEK